MTLVRLEGSRTYDEPLTSSQSETRNVMSSGTSCFGMLGKYNRHALRYYCVANQYQLGLRELNEKTYRRLRCVVWSQSCIWTVLLEEVLKWERWEPLNRLDTVAHRGNILLAAKIAIPRWWVPCGSKEVRASST